MTTTHDPRPEGVYCHWKDAGLGSDKVRLFFVERVNGNASVSTFECTNEEAKVIALSVAEEQWRQVRENERLRR